eukprot:Gb_25062 [translate_table: standard]
MGASGSWVSWMRNAMYSFVRRLLLCLVSAGPLPKHIAIIMDGNRRYADRWQMNKKRGHEFGYESLMSTLKDCYELGINYVTVYAFSIDNFRRSEEEVVALMDLMQQKLEILVQKESLVNKFGIRLQFLGNLELLPERVRNAAEKAMAATKVNDRAVLSVCVAYTSTQEIVHAVQGVCNDFILRLQGSTNGNTCIDRGASLDKEMEIEECSGAEEDAINAEAGSISVKDIEGHLYTYGCPDPDLLIRTSGETRLSNFLLWQSSFCYLHCCRALWPEFSFRHLFLAVLDYQRAYPFLKQKKAELKGLSCSD